LHGELVCLGICVLARLHSCAFARLHACTLAGLRACALARFRSCACALAHLRACALARLLAHSRACGHPCCKLGFQLTCVWPIHAPVLIKICGEWGSNSRPKDHETYALPTALSAPCSQSRFADVELPGWDMPAEHFVDDTFSVADGGMSLARNAKSKLTQTTQKAAKRFSGARKALSRPVPHHPQPSLERADGRLAVRQHR
jgi:hypothetical protein